MEISNQSIEYQKAAHRVKKLKGFYTHLAIYIIVNIFAFIMNYRELEANENILHWQLWTTPFFWGLGLLYHASRVFLPNFMFGNSWEERKIKELTEKYKHD